MRPSSTERALEARDHPFNLVRRRTIRPLHIAVPGRRDVSIGDDFDLLGDVVEDHQGIGEKKGKIRDVDVLLLAPRQLFERPDDVIAEITDGASDKARKVRDDDGSIGGHDFLEPFERFTAARNALLPLPPELNEVPVVLIDDNRRTAPQEGITRPLLSALDAFQQIRGRAVINFREGRDRRVVVRQNFAIEGNEIPLPGVPAEFLETERIGRRRHGFAYGS